MRMQYLCISTVDIVENDQKCCEYSRTHAKFWRFRMKMVQAATSGNPDWKAPNTASAQEWLHRRHPPAGTGFGLSPLLCGSDLLSEGVAIFPGLDPWLQVSFG